MAGINRHRGYGVKLVRGPFVQLDPHPESCRTPSELETHINKLKREDPDVRLAADLFSGAGGLSLGLQEAGFAVVISVDHYPEAVETHRHHFGGLSVNWDLSEAERVEALARVLIDNGVDLVAGGPPCQPFSKAGRSMIRYRVQHAQRDPIDERRDLWRSFMEVVRLALPKAVLMENVPDMALDKDMFILRAMVEELESLGYSVEERVVDTWRYGVPQFRQRLILIALRGNLKFTWPSEIGTRVSVWNAIGDMPEVEGGWRPEGGAEGFIEYSGPNTAFQSRMRRDVPATDSKKLFDHITRPVRADDVEAFEAMDSDTKYSDLPERVKRYRDDIFDDKYKRLNENDLSRTITAHIAKDGYWYIHPRQNRTLTVREAARLQTFPDHYRFSGPPSAAFKQIGNAVPPLLAASLGRAVIAAMDAEDAAEGSTMATAAVLAGWFDRRSSEQNLTLPWLSSRDRWKVVSAELLLERAEPDLIRVVWPLLKSWTGPRDALNQRQPLLSLGEAIGRRPRVERLLAIAEIAAAEPTLLRQSEVAAKGALGLAESIADIATLAAPIADAELGDRGSDGIGSGEPVLVTKGVLRVASRFFGDPVDRRNRLTDGRMAIARMIGGGSSARTAHLALIELAAAICRPISPKCSECPLWATCSSSDAEDQRAGHLFELPV